MGKAKIKEHLGDAQYRIALDIDVDYAQQQWEAHQAYLKEFEPKLKAAKDQRDALKAQYAAAGVALKDYLSPLQAASEAAYLSLSGLLMKTKKKALLDYGKLVGSHGRLVRRRWVLNEAMAEAELLSAPEIGPVAHTAAIYEAVEQMRASSIGKKALIALAIPLLVPLLILLSIQVPIKDILLTLLKKLA